MTFDELKEEYETLYETFIKKGLIDKNNRITQSGLQILSQIDVKHERFNEDEVNAFIGLFYGRISDSNINVEFINESCYGNYETDSHFIEDILYTEMVECGMISEKMIPFISYEDFYAYYKRNHNIEEFDGFYFDGNYIFC